MVKTKSSGHGDTSKSLKDEAAKALGPGGDRFIRVREDGAVCFGDDCVIMSRDEKTGALNMDIDPSACGTEAGSILFEHLVKTAGKGVNIRIPPQVK